MSNSPVARFSIWLFSLLVVVSSVAHAVGNSTPKVLPFQGRATDASGNPINYPVTIKFRIYPPAGSCYIYEDTQSVTPNAYGIFSVLLGTAGNSTGPATSFLQVFNNNTVAPINDSCAATYTPADGDWRRLELVIDGVALTQMQTIGTSAFAMSAELLGGKTASDFIQVNGALDQTNAELLVNGGDVGALHNHDARYARRDGSNTFSGNVSTSASIYATGAAGRVGIGTGAASADLHIVKTAPEMRLEATSSGGGSMSVDFYSGATQRGSVRANEGSDGLNFYSGTQLAISIDSNRASTFQGSIKSLGTVGLGQYTNAQEPALITALSGLGALATGTLWTNSTTNEIKYWDGSAAQVIATSGATVSSVTAGTGLIDSGTASDPNLSVAYGNAAGTALQGNQAFGGDVSGTALTIAVNQIKGYPLDFSAAPTTNQVLLFNGTSWVAAAAPANGITQINGQTAGSQTLAAGISGAVTMPTWNSASNNHALEFPFASTVGTYAGLVSYGELSGLVSTLSGKQDSLGYTPVNRAGDAMTGALTLAGDPSVNLGASTKQYVDSSTSTAGANYLRKDGTVTLTGDWDLGGSFKITNIPAPSANADAANKQYVDTVASAYVKRDGSVSMTGDLVLVADPSSALQASTKQYVDNTAANYLKKDGSVALTANWGVGGYDLVNVGNISLAAQKNIAMGGYTNAQEGALTTGFAAADSGRMWYNGQSNQIKYWDGSAVKTLGVAGSGITSLNGLAGVTQTLSTNTAVGTAPTWNSVGTDHELQIPLAANGAGVTAGLISNAELAGIVSTLSGKQAALGYAPLNRAGDAMTGALTLAGDPSVALGAATKQYVDNSLSAAGATYLLKDGSVTLTGNWDLGGSFKITNVPTPTVNSDAANKQYVDTGLATKQATIGYTPLNKAGDVMTGALTLAGDPSVALGAATKQYVDNSVANYVKYDGTISMTGGLTLVGDPTSALQAATKQYVDNGLSAKQATIGYTPLNKAGDVMTGALTLAGDPSVALGAATKQYVDNTAASYVKKDGSVSMAGALTLAGDPTAALQASTKQYVDNSVASYLKKDGSVALTATWSVGGFDFNNVGNISLAAQKNIAMGGYTNAQEGALTTGWGASDSGRMWYNAQSNQLKYWNGSTVSALGVAGSGLNSLNGLTGITQTLSTNTAVGTAPAWNSTGTDHELQIPLAANGAGVTAGLISNAELAGIVSTLSGKQAALGYSPLNKAGDAMTGALTLAADPSVALGAATKQYVDSSQATAGAAFVKKDGSVTLTGDWDLGGSFKITNVPTPTVNSDAVNKQYVDNSVANYLLRDGSVSMTGGLVLVGDPSSALQAATKQYVDNSQSTAGAAFVKKDGSVTLTGDWDLGGSFKITNIPTPTANSDASNKQYVDNSVANYIKKDGSIALTANWSVGGFDFNNVGNISLASQKNIAMGGYTNAQEGALTTGWGASDSGRMWYNAQSNQLKYWNGSAVSALGVAGSGLTSLNGLTGSTQTFSTNTATGTAPAWNSTGTDHELRIPLASNGAGVTAGLISNAELAGLVSTLSGKQASLGYSPLNKAGDAMTGALTLAGDPAVALGAATKQYVDNTVANYLLRDGSVSMTGGLVLVGDPSSALQAATKQYVDTGLSGKQASLGYTPLNKAGDAMTGALTLAADPTIALGAATKQYVDNKIMSGDISGPTGAITVTRISGYPINFSVAPSNNDVLKFNGTSWISAAPAATGITSFNSQTGGTQTLSFALSAAITMPAWNSASDDHQLRMPQASTAGTYAGLVSYDELSGIVSTLSGKQASLGYTPLNKAGDAMTGALTLAADPSIALGAATKQYVDNSQTTAGAAFLKKDGSVALTANWSVGGFDFNNVGSISLASQKNIAMGGYTNAQEGALTTGWGASDSGRMWYNAQSNQLKYWNGSTASALGVAGSGLTSLNGLSGNTQTFSTNTATGTAPAWNSTGTDHELRIPLAANGAGVTAGLISNAELAGIVSTLSGKQASLGYSPLNKAGDAMTGALTLAADPTIALGAATKQYVDNTVANYLLRDGSVSMTGGLVLVGDPSSALQAATKQYVDNGLSGKQASLGYTPLNKAGDAMTGALTLAADPSIALGAATKQYVDNKIMSGDISGPTGAITVSRINGYPINFSVAPSNNDVLKFNGTSWISAAPAATGITSLNGLSGATQTFSTNTATGTAPAWNSTGTDHELRIPLAANGAGVTAGLISNAELAGIISTLSGKQASLGYTALNKAGDAMTGALTLAADPSIALGAATKQYVDNAQTTAGAAFLKKDGSVTLTGNWDLGGSFKITNVPTPTVNADAANKQYVDNSVANYLLRDGSVSMTGGLVLVGDPSSALQAATKQYVDTGLSGKQASLGYTPLNKAGDAMTGALTLAADPTINLGAATKQYVDNKLMSGDISGPTGAITVSHINGYPINFSVAPSNNDVLKFNGTSWISAAPAATGITSLNGLSGATQTFSANTATGTAPAWNSTGTDHELRIPLAANGAGVTAGLISNAELAGIISTLSGKQASLGYTPLNKAGDAMTGALTLAADPSIALGAATKQYVDNAQTTAGAAFLKKDGSVTLTGNWDLGGSFKITNVPTPTVNADAANKQYVDNSVANYLLRDGSVSMTGGLVLVGDPSSALQAATKQYVDNGLSGKQASLGYTPLNKAGDAMTGALTLAADPTINLGAATKQYVDNKIMSGDISGPTGAITVSRINGYPINFSVAPSNNDVLKFNGTSWISAAPAATGITSLNGLSGATQTFSTNTATGTAPAWNSTGTDHELRIPLAANGAGVTAGLISNAELAGIISTLSGKQASLGYTPLNKAGDAMTGALTLAADPSIALGAATKQYVDNSVASYIKKDGSVTLTGNWNAGTLSITAGGYTGGAFFYSSDRRLKKNIRDIDGLDLILRMRGVAFQWRNTGDEDLGLIAQEVEEVAPQLVTTNPVTGMKAVKYGNVVGPLIEATKTLHNMCVANWDRLQKVETKLDRNIASVKEVQGDVKALEKSVSDLKAENAQLRQDLQALKELVQKQLKSTKTK